MMKRILGICGSIRAHSSHKQLLNAATRLVPEGCEVVIYSGIDKLPFFNQDLDGEHIPRAAKEFRETVARSHGLFISSPEFAHGVPGALKNALDWLVGSTDFENTPVVLVCGGEFAPLQLEETLKTMSANFLGKASTHGLGLQSCFTANGDLINENLAKDIRELLKLF